MKTASTVATLLLIFALSLTACSNSPHNRYYLLTARDFTPPTGAGPSIGVGPIEVAEYLAGDRLISRHEGNALHLAQAVRWAEPLPQGIARVLHLNLAGLLNTQDVRRYPWQRRDAPPLAVHVRVLELGTSAGQALLVAEWRLYQPDDGAVLQRGLNRFNTPVADDASAAATATAYSELLAKLGEVLAGALVVGSDSV